MTIREFENIRLPALVRRITGESSNKKVGDIFIVVQKNGNLLLDSENIHKMHLGHWFGYVELIQENYDIERNQMLEIEESL